MPISDIHPEAIKLIDRMTGATPSHIRFTGERIDAAQIDPLALGDVWAVAHATRRRLGAQPPDQSLAAETARLVLDLGKRIEPAFRGSACRDYLDFLSRNLEDDPARASGFLGIFPWREACFALDRCFDLSFEGLGAAARRFLAAADWRALPHLAMAMARLVEPPFETLALAKLAVDLADSPLLIDEVRAVSCLDLRANITVAAVVCRETTETEPSGESSHPLSALPDYVEFAEATLRQAAERVRQIHDCTTPYVSDKAFTRDEAVVIARLMRVALDRDEPWAPLVLDELFGKVSIAPTAAKTLPSQAVAIALGHAVEAFPTPEAVATLRGVVRDIRHAGVKKKLQRNLRGAELGLPGRPEIALRLPLDQPLGKAQLTTLSRCLEAGLASGLALNFDDWRARLAAHAQAKVLAGSLVWTIRDAAGGCATVLPMLDRGRLALQDVEGASVAADTACRVALWHPLNATAQERDSWRDRLAALQIKQPFKQVFREQYVVAPADLSKNETALFADHVVSITPFVGLARGEGWRLEYDSLTRRFGRWTARLDLADPVYPGCGGGTTTRNLTLWTSYGKMASPAPLCDFPSVLLSEVLRAVGLLVSTSGFAVTGEDADASREARLLYLARRPLGAMAEMRKHALERALRGLDGMDGLQFDSRRLRLGPYAIHLATGRVTCAGEPVTIEPPKQRKIAAVPWLPYDERLLEAILHSAIEIAKLQKSPPRLA